MSTSLEWRATLRVGTWISIGFLVLLGVLALGASLVLSNLLWDDFEDQWHREVRAMCPKEFEGTEQGQALLDPQLTARLRASVDRNLQSKLLWLLIPSLVIGFGGGLLITALAMRNLRRIVRAVDRIRLSGNFEERLPVPRGLWTLPAVTQLFNEMFAQTEQQMHRFRESLDHVAHDLRTPLTRLRMSAQQALRSPGSPDSYREKLGDCLEESEQLVDVLNTLMSIAEAEAGALRLARRSVDVAGVAREVVDMYAFLGEDRGITVTYEGPPGLQIDGDPTFLRQALANLVDNAVKFSPEGGSVQIEAGREGDELAIRVIDEGPGIPEPDLERIWGRLYRGDASRQQPGLGLGLSFVQAIARSHGGTARAANRPEGGSVFTLRLPA